MGVRLLIHRQLLSRMEIRLIILQVEETQPRLEVGDPSGLLLFLNVHPEHPDLKQVPNFDLNPSEHLELPPKNLNELTLLILLVLNCVQKSRVMLLLKL